MVEPGPDFTPPFCPNPRCDFHLKSRGWRFKDEHQAYPRALKRLLTWVEILSERLLATRIALDGPLEGYYWGRISTRQMPEAREHRLQYAY